MSTVERIQSLLDCEVRIPQKDDANIITPEGIDSAVRIKAIEECLIIAKSEYESK